MRNLSIKMKITLWFSIAILLIVGITNSSMLAISNMVIQNDIKTSLMEMVESNADEVEYFQTQELIHLDGDKDLYINYGMGILEIDDDFLDRLNGIYTALYDHEGNLLYGENPIVAKLKDISYEASKLQRVTVDGIKYYVYDRRLTGDGLENLWLRGIISEERGTAQTNTIVRLSLWLLPILAVLALVGGYFLAGRFLSPIKSLSEAAEEIREGQDLTRRIELKDGNDELHRLGEAFNSMLDRLEKSFQLEQQFTSDASHELRTPVSVILSQCEYSLEETRPQEEYKEALEVIERQSKKMSRLIGDMLAVTRLGQGTEHIKMAEIDLTDLTEVVCKDMEGIGERNISMERYIEPNLKIRGNRELMIRLITNLVENAYRYGKQDGKILVKLYSEEDKVKLSVSDDGIGIDEKNIEKIWNRFYQEDSSRVVKGIGLGLAMVKEIATVHGGEITVQSTLDQGSVFTFTIKNYYSNNPLMFRR